MNGKSLVITEADFDRLNGLVASRQGRVVYGSLAEHLRYELGRGKVVPPTRVSKDLVTMNSRVRIRDIKSDHPETYTLVFPHEANISTGLLSVLAPLGTALLGAKLGDIIELETPGGIRRIKVEKILYQPEAAGDFHL
jgi:regulator of nucleoside diphosphate kinase